VTNTLAYCTMMLITGKKVLLYLAELSLEHVNIFLGATTLGIMTLGIMTLGIMTLGIMTLGIMTLGNHLALRQLAL
jgi:deleted-in-malignant-brain-tumors protein 1